MTNYITQIYKEPICFIETQQTFRPGTEVRDLSETKIPNDDVQIATRTLRQMVELFSNTNKKFKNG